MPRRHLAPAAALLLVLGAAACGSSTTSTNASPTTIGPPASTAPSAPVADEFAAGPVPAVTGASDLKAEPTVHAATTPAPAKLVGADLVVGTGQVASPSSTVEIQYVGALYTNGSVFDASWTDSGPISSPLSQFVPGFSQGLVGMRVGGRRELVIPPALGYGDQAQANGKIPANSTLVFVVDLLGVS